MGSRAVVLVCRDPAVARRRFDAPGDESGAVWTRTGRAFLSPELTGALLSRVGDAVDAAGLWDELATDWLLLDAELMPWSLKAGDLLRRQYAAVGAAGRAVLPAAIDALAAAAAAGRDVGDLLARTTRRRDDVAAFTDAYQRYCWPTDGLAGVRLAPFAVLATEGTSWAERAHADSLAVADRLAARDGGLFATTRRTTVDPADERSVAAGTAWWERLTAAGGEGMVVKPAAGLVRGRGGLVQPGLKVRGREYLRIVYGPEYLAPHHLERLRVRSLGRKRSLASREYALGVEALDRLTSGQPLWRIHEAVFAVLALETEPVDPRL